MKIVTVTHPQSELLDALNALLPQLSPTARPLDADALTQIVTSDCCTLYAATQGAAVLGCLTLVRYRIPSRRHAWIEDAVVAAPARGKGIGEALVRHAIEQARAWGADRIGLSSSPERIAANRLYQKIGFKERDTNVYHYTFAQEPS